jgi:Asp/Glu/hydantoin racemase
MSLKVCFLHSISISVNQFNELAQAQLPPEVTFFHIADEAIQKVVLEVGGLNPFLFRRVAEDVLAAEHAGADIIQFTCSSISPCVDAVREMVPIPILKIDVPMVDIALSMGKRLGVAATAHCTLKPTTDLVFERAKVLGKDVKVDSRLCEGAYEAMFSEGDPEKHDQIVRQTLSDLMSENDVIVLAQASMARVADTILEKDKKAPILSSPKLAMEHLNELILSMM